MSLPRQGIFCVEGAWESKLTDRSSVLPTLDTLERLRIATYIHRDVGTFEEPELYLRKWGQKQYATYEVLYIASHGTPGAIQLGRNTISLEELADCIGRRAAERVIYFGSCGVMADRRAVADFQTSTKAKLVCGYRKTVSWVESAGFDLILLDSLVSGRRIDARVNRIHRRFPDITKVLGFVSHPSFPRGT